MTQLNIEISEEAIIKALLELPPDQRNKIVDKVKGWDDSTNKWLKIEELEPLIGLINIGGDAVKDSERIYSDSDSD